MAEHGASMPAQTCSGLHGRSAADALARVQGACTRQLPHCVAQRGLPWRGAFYLIGNGSCVVNLLVYTCPVVCVSTKRRLIP